MAEGGPVSEPAPAKLNVFLRVLGRRADGYHDLESLVQPLTLVDGIQVRAGEDLSLAVAGGRVPVEGNLVLRAAEVLREAAGVRSGATIALVKRIPVAAGLGGGSADAAASLRALNDLWRCGLSAEDLAGLGAAVGSDVPALVHGVPVLVGGRGEVVEPVEVARTWWVLLPLGFPVAAADAYRWWDEDGGPSGGDPRPVVDAARAGDLDALVPFNDLQGPVGRRYPEVGPASERLVDAGALRAVMCGSGPTVAGLCRDGGHAETVAEAVGGIAVAGIVRPSGRGMMGAVRGGLVA